MPATRMTFAVPAEEGDRFAPDMLIDEVLLTGGQLADGAVVVDTTEDGPVTRVTLDVYT